MLFRSAATYAFVEQALPLIDRAGLDLTIYYVASAELFDLLPEAEREAIFPNRDAHVAMGITDFTLPTMDRWVRSARGRANTLYPFRGGHFLGSGQGAAVIAEAGLSGESQFAVISAYIRGLRPQS